MVQIGLVTAQGALGYMGEGEEGGRGGGEGKGQGEWAGEAGQGCIEGLRAPSSAWLHSQPLTAR